MDDIRDIKAPVPLPSAAAPDAWLAGLGLLLLGGLALWRWRRLRKRPQCRELAAVRRALAALSREAGVLGDGDYYFRLAALVRRVLALRLGLAATAMSAPELASRLDALPAGAREAVAGLFARAEAACYAGQAIPSDQRHADGLTAARLAADTRPC